MTKFSNLIWRQWYISEHTLLRTINCSVKDMPTRKYIRDTRRVLHTPLNGLFLLLHQHITFSVNIILHVLYVQFNIINYRFFLIIKQSCFIYNPQIHKVFSLRNNPKCIKIVSNELTSILQAFSQLFYIKHLLQSQQSPH